MHPTIKRSPSPPPHQHVERAGEAEATEPAVTETLPDVQGSVNAPHPTAPTENAPTDDEMARWESDGGPGSRVPDDELVAAARDVTRWLSWNGRGDAEDRSQRAVELLLKRRPPFSYRGASELRCWLFTTARGFRPTSPWLVLADPSTLSGVPANDNDIEEIVIKRETVRRVRRFIEQLPPAHREAITAALDGDGEPMSPAVRATVCRLRRELRRLAA